MVKKNLFVTLYPKCHNQGIIKDVGQIPDTLGKNYKNFETKLVSSIIDLNDKNFPQLSGMKFEKIPFIMNNEIITGFIYIIRNAKNVDWFNFYHGGRRCYYWTKLYKFLNPYGKVYLKMDLSYEGCEKYIKSKREKKIFLKTFSVSDIVSVESKPIKELVETYTGAVATVIPNGYIHLQDSKFKKINREKRFITVGRLGTPEKATNILLDAFADSSAYHDWELRLIGPVEPSFRLFIKEFFNKYPNLKRRVTFTGPIYDKEKLYSEYRAARTFVLPSLWEASPLVCPEALGNGCRMILSDVIPAYKEFTNDSLYGRVVKSGDKEGLKKAFIAETKYIYDNDWVNIKEYAENNFTWDAICEKLYGLMQEKNE